MRNVEKIRKKYGAKCYQRWGRLGGSPVLRAWAEKRVVILKKRKK